MPRIVIRLVLLAGLTNFSLACSHGLKNEDSAVDAAAPTSTSASLYNRIGGEEVLKNFANQFVKQMALDAKLTKNPQIAAALIKNQDRHKEKLVTLLCQISGGPCKYDGRSLKDAHASLKITQEEWKEMARVFIQVLQKMNVPKRERQELAALVSKYKTQIVTK